MRFPFDLVSDLLEVGLIGGKFLNYAARPASFNGSGQIVGNFNNV